MRASLRRASQCGYDVLPDPNLDPRAAFGFDGQRNRRVLAVDLYRSIFDVDGASAQNRVITLRYEAAVVGSEHPPSVEGRTSGRQVELFDGDAPERLDRIDGQLIDPDACHFLSVGVTIG